MSDEKYQFDLAQSIKRMRENMPAMLEIVELDALQKMAKFRALVKAGFTEAQALELCK